MLEESKDWYAISSDKSTVLRCAFCKNEFDLGFTPLDHHPGVCPVCGVECVYLNWKGRIVQIIIKNAPPVLVQAVRWAQAHLDELEYVELVCALEELSDAMTLDRQASELASEAVFLAPTRAVLSHRE